MNFYQLAVRMRREGRADEDIVATLVDHGVTFSGAQQILFETPPPPTPPTDPVVFLQGLPITMPDASCVTLLTDHLGVSHGYAEKLIAKVRGNAPERPTHALSERAAAAKPKAPTTVPLTPASAKQYAQALLRDGFTAPVIVGQLTKEGIHVDQAIRIISEIRGEALGAR